VSAQPAENDYADDYAQSQPARVLFRRPATVISLPLGRSTEQNPPESKRDEPVQTRTPDSGPDSGTRITVGDVPGEWESVTTVWTDAPEPLCDLVGRVTVARDPERTATDLALACWAVLVLTPRGLLHLASWVLTHPLRLLAAAAVVAVFLATL
jgi:hypothetical protein